MGLSKTEQMAEATKLLKEIQTYNKSKDTYGKIPTMIKDTV